MEQIVQKILNQFWSRKLLLRGLLPNKQIHIQDIRVPPFDSCQNEKNQKNDRKIIV